MIALIRLALAIVTSLFKSRARLEAENAVLLQRLIVLRRKLPGRVGLTNADRLFFGWLYRLFPSETVHHASLLHWLGLTPANGGRLLTINPPEKPGNRHNQWTLVKKTGANRRVQATFANLRRAVEAPASGEYKGI